MRYRFPGRRFIDAIVDIPFALPTAVAGIALASIYAPNGWIGSLLAPFNIRIAFSRAGIVVALIFIGLPFVVRTVQPIMEEISREVEEAAATLGASRFQTIWRVLLPSLQPAVLTGFALAFARGVGEYGSVIFIAGNTPYVSEIAPLLIVIRLEEYDYAGATALATVMLALSFAMLLFINLIQSGQEGSTAMSNNVSASTQSAVTESLPTRILLIAIALVFLALFLILPVIAVFVEAFRKGAGEYFAALVEPDAGQLSN